jgi:POT family proton-dependent oligopeptide transporter
MSQIAGTSPDSGKPSLSVNSVSSVDRPKYRTTPDQTDTRMPRSIPYIVGNECAERFSFYGVRAILATFMTTFLMNRTGQLDVMTQNEAQAWAHQFVGAVYFLPVLGGIIADGFLGKYRTILYLSIVYCFGHLALSIDDTRLGLFLGLSLIALGAGGIKSSVSANVGDQFGAGNQHLLARAFGWFYFSINVGSSFSIALCPILLNNPHFGPHYAFGLPGIFMALATIVFFLGRKKFVHVPPAGLTFWREVFSREGLSAIGRLAIVYAFVVVFWALWDQSAGIEWTLQARSLDLHFLGITLLPEQVQIANAILVLSLIPIFNYLVYPCFDKFFPLTPLRKFGIGLFLTAASFAVIWWLQTQIDAGSKPSVWWQLLAYLLLTSAEVLVSITGLEFSYTQAPKTMKSAVMSLWLLTVWGGNQFVALLNFVLPRLRPFGVNLDGAAYFRFFTLLMLFSAVLFVFVSRAYRGKTYLQDEKPIET